MPSEGASTVPRMGSFQRAFLGYRRPEVDAAIRALNGRVHDLGREVAEKAEIEAEVASLSGMVIEREREIRNLNEQLREANERHQRSFASLEAATARLQEIEAQARGQATRIRMKALREAVEVGRRAQELAHAEAGAEPEIGAEAQTGAELEANGHVGVDPAQLFEGPVRMEVGPLGDYSQLVGLEDAIGRLGASEISIERFSEGRATLSMQLDEPVALLRELEEGSPLEFKIRRNEGDGLILDVDDESGSGRAA
jgi:DNA repair exonuclease SbcCD ATPase subunit